VKHSTLFIDESGKASLIDRKYEDFLLTGVILDDDDLKTVEGFFNYIKRRNGLDLRSPFHSYDLFENPKSKISTTQAKVLLSTISDFISIIPIKINIIQANKEMFRKALGVKGDSDFKGDAKNIEMKELPYRVMAIKLFSWFAEYLEKSESIGQIVADSRKGGDSQLIKSLTLSKDQPTLITADDSRRIKERCSAICFAEKNFLSGGLEITDLISYSAFFHIRRMMTTMKACGLPKIWTETRINLRNAKIDMLKTTEVKKFFNIGRGEVYKALKNKVR
jgi:hypothetical protein